MLPGTYGFAYVCTQVSLCPDTVEPLSSHEKALSSRGLNGCMNRAASLIAGLDTISFKDVDKEPFTSLQTAFWPHRETP